ncbi:hypothetical protein [Nostoc sp.]|uniref:hypothetical protein n=1 Tax=Nostoc sp. TaxID=1180 RepID=UPI002FF6DCF1
MKIQCTLTNECENRTAPGAEDAQEEGAIAIICRVVLYKQRKITLRQAIAVGKTNTSTVLGLTNKNNISILLVGWATRAPVAKGGLSCPPHKMDNLFLGNPLRQFVKCCKNINETAR